MGPIFGNDFVNSDSYWHFIVVRALLMYLQLFRTHYMRDFYCHFIMNIAGFFLCPVLLLFYSSP